MLKTLLDLFFPHCCLACKGLLFENEKIVCTKCRHDLPLTQHIRNKNNPVFQSFYGKVAVEEAVAFLYFQKNETVQELIHNLKYRGHQEIGTFLGEWFLEDLKGSSVFSGIDEVVSVPLHPKKFRKRGYNQITSFAQIIAKGLGASYNEQLLYRKKNNSSQSKKNKTERSGLLTDVFEVQFSVINHNKHYLLIDDVMTTGATLEACCNALLKIPNIRISILCIAFADM